MKKLTIRLLMASFMLCCAMPAMAQFNLKKAVSAGTKAVQAATLTDAQMAAYVKESVDWMDKHNPVLPEDNPYTQRLRKPYRRYNRCRWNSIELQGISCHRHQCVCLPRRQCPRILFSHGYHER